MKMKIKCDVIYNLQKCVSVPFSALSTAKLRIIEREGETERLSM